MSSLLALVLSVTAAQADDTSLSVSEPATKAPAQEAALAPAASSITAPTRTPSRWSLGFSGGGSVMGSFDDGSIGYSLQFFPVEARFHGKKRMHSIDVQYDWLTILASLVNGEGAYASGTIYSHWRVPVTGEATFTVAPGLRVAGGKYDLNFAELTQITGTVDTTIPIRLGLDVPSRKGHIDYGIYLRPEFGQQTVFGSHAFTVWHAGAGAEFTVTWRLFRR